jgi:hypothetical protein
LRAALLCTEHFLGAGPAAGADDALALEDSDVEVEEPVLPKAVQPSSIELDTMMPRLLEHAELCVFNIESQSCDYALWVKCSECTEDSPCIIQRASKSESVLVLA